MLLLTLVQCTYLAKKIGQKIESNSFPPKTILQVIVSIFHSTTFMLKNSTVHATV